MTLIKLGKIREDRVEIAFGTCTQNNDFEPDATRRRLHVSRQDFGLNEKGRVDEQSKHSRGGDQLVHHFQPLRSQFDVQRGDAREIAARLAQAGDIAKCHRVAPMLNTMGVVLLAALATGTAGLVLATITLTPRRTRSAAKPGSRSRPRSSGIRLRHSDLRRSRVLLGPDETPP